MVLCFIWLGSRGECVACFILKGSFFGDFFFMIGGSYWFSLTVALEKAILSSFVILDETIRKL